MDKFIEKSGLISLLFVFVLFSFVFQYYSSALAIAAILVVNFFYSLFYTSRPRLIWIFILVGVPLSVWNIFYRASFYIYLFTIIAILECLRVVFAAILNYPQTIKELKELTDELEQRVDQRTAELAKANEELRELDRMKSAFVSQASHDLRTPLTAIKGSLDNLALGIAGELNEKQQKILARATRSVDRLTDLVNDVLDLARIESGRAVLEKSRISLRGIIEHILQENQTAAAQKKIALTPILDNDACYLFADGGKIERIAGELVGNAIKYTPENGDVEIRLQQVDGKALLTVKDSGIGIAAADLPKIWDRFYRTAASQKAAKGSGLGLSIAKELTEMHGGSLTVESQEGAGTIFSLSLPLPTP